MSNTTTPNPLDVLQSVLRTIGKEVVCKEDYVHKVADSIRESVKAGLLINTVVRDGETGKVLDSKLGNSVKFTYSQDLAKSVLVVFATMQIKGLEEGKGNVDFKIIADCVNRASEIAGKDLGLKAWSSDEVQLRWQLNAAKDATAFRDALRDYLAILQYKNPDQLEGVKAALGEFYDELPPAYIPAAKAA